MRHAYPLLYCLPEDTQAALLGRITGLDSIPWEEWVEWLTPEVERYIEDYDRFMRQPPSRSRGKE